MRCPSCKHENATDAAYCEECGAQMEGVCPSCAELNRPGAKFRRKCGHGLAQLTATSPVSPSKFTAPDSYTPRHLAEKIITSKAAVEGERKQVTVLFAKAIEAGNVLANRDFLPSSPAVI